MQSPVLTLTYLVDPCPFVSLVYQERDKDYPGIIRDSVVNNVHLFVLRDRISISNSCHLDFFFLFFWGGGLLSLVLLLDKVRWNPDIFSHIVVVVVVVVVAVAAAVFPFESSILLSKSFVWKLLNRGNVDIVWGDIQTFCL